MEDRLFYLRKSSLDKKHVEASLQNFDNLEDKIKCFRVNCMSINDLIRQYIGEKEIDLILIDAEGHDDKIVRTIDFETICPKAILFEAHNLDTRKQDLYDFLGDKGYTVSDIGGDSVAVCN